ncbi:homologous recombination OB-fold protein isoform X3 [Rhineura floridana]|nr:homologous recombination OB-fold protein isoform X2 [Rhineura floridana]XP_061444868.1 homologous recombination OB-fold protein isoform X3 [Rhineura floridana]XP_061444869.1 homologous recombination OB-fold protein isoform X3 [Rhineura floridana]
MACGLQKLFSVEADFEDEDFLLAVNDVEKQAVDPAPGILKSLRPISAGLRAPSSTIMPVSEGPRVPLSPVLQVQNCSRLKFGEGRYSSNVKRNQMTPLVTGFTVQKELASLPAECKSNYTSGTRFKFVKRPPAKLPAGSAPCDECDSELVLAACMDLEESDMQSDPGSFSSDCGSLGQIKDNSVATAKKPRVADSLTLTNPIGSETSQLKRAQNKPMVEVTEDFPPAETSPKLTLRPNVMGSSASQSNLWMSSSPGALSNFSCQTLQPVQASLHKPIPACNSPCLPMVRPCSSFQSAGTPQRPPKPWIPSQSCSVSRMANTGAQLLSAYGSSMTSAETPLAMPKVVGNLQTPVVTNHLVRLVTAANKTTEPTAHVPLRAKARRFPGPAGILPQQPDGKNLEEILITTPQTPTHGALAKLQMEEIPTSQQPIEDEFGRGPWVAMKTELGLDERNPSCFLRTYSIVMVLRKAALKQLPKNKVPKMAVMIKSLMRTNVDAGAVFKDPTGEMQGTIHRLLLEEKESEFKAGSVLLLKQVGVFSPSHRNHYLNVTPSNLVKIYPPGFSSGKPPQLCQETGEIMEMIQSQAVPEFQQDPAINAPSAMAAPDYRSGQGHEMDENGYQHESASDKGSPLIPVPGACEAGKSALSVPSPKAERTDADDLDQLLGELPDDFFSNFDVQSSL